MQTNEKLTEILNGLIEINHDRVNGYEKAIEAIINLIRHKHLSDRLINPQPCLSKTLTCRSGEDSGPCA